MIQEALKVLAEQAVKAAGPQMREIDPHKNYAFVDSEGNNLIRSADIRPRAHTVLDLETIQHFGKQPGAVTWYSREAVVVVLDDHKHRENMVRMTLEPSPQMAKLIELAKQKPALPQREFIYLLRTSFKDCLAGAGNFLENVRKLNFKLIQEADGERQHGKSSVGKSTRAEVAGQGTIPEVVPVIVPVFKSGFTHILKIECVLDIDEVAGTFAFFPTPQDIEKAFQEAEDVLHGHLQSLELEPLFGKP